MGVAERYERRLLGLLGMADAHSMDYNHHVLLINAIPHTCGGAHLIPCSGL